MRWIALAAVLLLVPLPAEAQKKVGKVTADDARRDQAQSLLTEGNRLFGDGEYVAALAKFKAAYEKFPSPKLLLNEAATLRLLGRNVDAAVAYERYLGDPGADASKTSDVKRAVTEIDALVARVRVHASVDDATIAIDGTQIDARAPLRVDPGDHAIVAERAGYLAEVANVKLLPGEDRIVELRMRKPGERIVVQAPPTPGATQRAVGYVVGAAGIASLAAAGVFTIISASKKSEAKSLCVPSQAFEGALVCSSDGTAVLNSAGDFGTAANWTSIGGAIALAAGVTLVLTAPSANKKEKPPATVSLRAAPGSIAIVGRF